MLVADAEPHFEFFMDETDDAKPFACAHQVFCGMALMMRADVYTKITFLLRLYADSVGQLTAESKRTMLRDFLLALQLVFNLAAEIPAEVVSILEVSAPALVIGVCVCA